jgi:hypothetical protein
VLDVLHTYVCTFTYGNITHINHTHTYLHACIAIYYWLLFADDEDRYLDNVEQYYEEVAQDGSFKEFRRTGVYAFRIEVPENTDKVSQKADNVRQITDKVSQNADRVHISVVPNEQLHCRKCDIEKNEELIKTFIIFSVFVVSEEFKCKILKYFLKTVQALISKQRYIHYELLPD